MSRETFADGLKAALAADDQIPPATPVDAVVAHAEGALRAIGFAPDVAYMPVPRCDGCAHWLASRTANGQSRIAVGRCAMPFSTAPPQRVLLGRTPFLTRADYGCVEWKERA